MKGIIGKLLSLVMVLMLPGFLFAGGSSDQAKQSEIKVGFICPLTGDAAFLGEEMSTLVKYVDKEINGTGGINGMKVNIIMEDDAGGSSGAAKAAQKLTSVDKVSAIVGPLFTTCVLAAKPIVNGSKTPLITGTSNHDDIFLEKGYVFSIDATDELVVKNLVKHLNGMKGYKKISLLGAYNDQTLQMLKLFRDLWPGEIVSEATYNPGTEDFRTELTKVKGVNPDVLWVGADTEEMVRIVRQMTELGMKDLYIAGDYQAIQQDFLDRMGSVVDGRLCYSQGGVGGDEPTKNKADAFISGYKNQFSADPDPVLLIYYDCLRIVFEALKKGAYSGEKLRDAMAATKDFVGTSGHISFDSKGASEGSSTVIEYRNGKRVQVPLK
jgi:branched-chain amino acid transport system substrate-binding protein